MVYFSQIPRGLFLFFSVRVFFLAVSVFVVSWPLVLTPLQWQVFRGQHASLLWYCPSVQQAAFIG